MDFKMGKENVLTGKPEAIGPLNSSNKKNSFVNATQSPAHKVKYSKFKQNWFYTDHIFINPSTIIWVLNLS